MKKNLRHCDKPLLFLTIAFSIIGLLMVFSASSIISAFSETTSASRFFIRQLLFVSATYIAFFIFILHFPLKKYNYFTILYGLFTLVSLLLVLFLGETINGAQSWFRFGRFNYQPSEFVKVFVILYLAFYFQKYQRRNTQARVFYYPLIVVLIVVFLILRQPDLGTALIILGLVAGIYLALPLTKNNKKNLVIYGLIAALIAVAFVFLKGDILKGFQLDRLNFSKPCSRYVQSTGYQLCNSFIAINNGGLFGVGLGNSTQKFLYLPAAHTDFIFSIILEELGSIVGIIILIGYIFMLFRILKIAKQADNIRNSIIAYGTFVLITLHIIVNLSGIIGLLPLTGVPLPLLSYGGSFTIVTYILIFLTQRVAVENNQKKISKKISKI